MNYPDLTYSIPQNVYEKLVSIAKKLEFSSEKDAADITISFIHCQIGNQIVIPENIAVLRQILQSSSSEFWNKEEKLILFAHFLLTYSLNVAVHRFRKYSTKSFADGLMKLKILATKNGMFFFK